MKRAPLLQLVGTAPLRALTIYKAWAGAILNGDKTIEVRSRPLKYRGLLLIHEAQERPVEPGAVIGIADLYDCRPLTADDLRAALLPEMPAGRAWGLHLRDALRLPGGMRIEWRGRQGLWKPERRAGGDPGELREVLVAAFGPWGRRVAAAAERAELRLSWRLGKWRLHPYADPNAEPLYRTSASTPSHGDIIGTCRSVAVCGSEQDGERARRELCRERRLFIGTGGDKWLAAVKARRTVGVTEAERQARAEAAALGMEVEWEPGRGWTLRKADGSRETLPNLGDVSERLHQIKTMETKLRVTKREVTEAAVQVGLRFPQEKTPEGEWVLEDEAGEVVRTDRSLASLLQHCRDHKDTLWRETAEAARAVGLHLKRPEPEHEGAGGLWLLVDAEGKTVQSEWILPPLLQRCRDRQTAVAEGTWGYRGAERLCDEVERADRARAADEAAPEAPETAPAVAALMEDAAGSKVVDHGCVEEEVDRLYGDGADYDRDRVTAEARHHLGQGAMAMLEAGRRLCWLREREPHGQWLGLLERIGISRAVASKMMQAARKFLGTPNVKLVQHLASVTKAYELAMLDDDDLDELRKGSAAAGMTLDDIQRMTPTELRDTLRRERKERKAREAAQRQRMESKDSHIGRLEEVSDDLHRRLDDALNPGRLTPTQAGRELLIETARVGRELEVALDNTTAVVRRLYQLSEAGRVFVEGHEMTPPALPQELVHVRAQLDAIATSAHRALGELDEQLSDPLVTAPPPPADADAGPWGAAHWAANGPSAQDDDE